MYNQNGSGNPYGFQNYPQQSPPNEQHFINEVPQMPQNFVGYPPVAPPPPPLQPQPKKHTGVWIAVIICVIVLAAAGIVAVFLMMSGNSSGGDSPQGVAEKYTKAYVLGDFDTADNYSLFSSTIFYDYIGIKDDFEILYKDQFEAKYGDVDQATITISKVNIKNSLSKNKLNQLKNILAGNDLDIDTGKISDAKAVTVSYKIEGKKKSGTSYLDLYGIKYDGEWKIIQKSHVLSLAGLAKIEDYTGSNLKDFIDEYADNDDDDYDQDEDYDEIIEEDYTYVPEANDFANNPYYYD